MMFELNLFMKFSDICVTEAKIRMEPAFLSGLITICLSLLHKN